MKALSFLCNYNCKIYIFNGIIDKNRGVEMNKRSVKIKNYLLIILIFIIIACFAYLSYYKFVIYDKKDLQKNSNNNIIEDKNDGDKNNSKTSDNESAETNNQSKEDNNGQTNNAENGTYIGNKIFEKIINNKHIFIELKFYKIENEDNAYVKYDIYINNKLLSEKPEYKMNHYYISLGNDIEESLIDKYTNDAVEIITKLIDKGLGIIKSDKEYLYIKTYSKFPAGSEGVYVIVLNENGQLITTETLSVAGQSISKANNCNYNFYKNKNEFNNNEDSSYYIDDSSIYYLVQKSLEPISTVNEYSITIKNDTATKKIVNTCEAEISGAVY